MYAPILQLPLDTTGVNPDNFVGNEEHLLVKYDNCDYYIIKLYHGGFYSRSLRVYDANYKRLEINKDYIVTYYFQRASEYTGLEVVGLIVFLNKPDTDTVFTSAQMVGGDLAFSFTMIQDWINWWNDNGKPTPSNLDYAGNEPVWAPGELVQERWHLDTYQPFNVEIEWNTQAAMIGNDNVEDKFRDKVRLSYEDFLKRFNDRLQVHIDDKNNPHKVTPTQIGLGLVRNLEVSSLAEALKGTSDDYYLTPELAYKAIDELAIKPLNLHIGKQDNPHQVTPAQAKAYSIQQSMDLLATKYLKTETVANTNTVKYTPRFGTETIYSYTGYVSAIRSNLDASNFQPAGMGIISPERLGGGTYNNLSVLRGNGLFTTVDMLLEEYGQKNSSNLGIVAYQGSDQATLDFIRATYVDLNAWPVGSLIFYRGYTQQWEGAGNGAHVIGYYPVFAVYRAPNGWVMT